MKLDQLENEDHPALMVLLVKSVFLDLLDYQVVKEIVVFQVHPALQGHLVYKVIPETVVKTAVQACLGPKESEDRLVLPVDKDQLDHRVLPVLLAKLVFLED